MGCHVCNSQDKVEDNFCALCRERQEIIPIFAELRDQFEKTKRRTTFLIITLYALNIHFFLDKAPAISLYSSIVGTICSIAYLLRVAWCYKGTIKNLIIVRDQLRNDPNLN